MWLVGTLTYTGRLFVARLANLGIGKMRLSKDTEMVNHEALRSRLRHVYWIGGGSINDRQALRGFIWSSDPLPRTR